MRKFLPALILIALALVSTSALAQPGFVALQDSATAAIAELRSGDLEALAPVHVDRARKAYDEAEAMAKRNGEPALMAIKYRVTMDELAAARTAAHNVRIKIPGVITARSGARAAHADSLVPAAWERAEQQLGRAVHEIETGRAPSASDAEDIAGAYRVARRDALRTGVLSQVWKLSEEMDRRRSEKTVPVLSLRVHQAISRAEAALAKDSLDLAHAEGVKAARLARRTLDILTQVERAQKADARWEAAILPYDDVLDTVAAYFQAPLDYSNGVANASKSLLDQVHAHDDTLRARLTHLEQTNASLEQSLADAQTSLADAQNRVVELERRMSAAEGERTTSRARLQAGEQLSRAQGHFPAGQATVLQNDRGQIVIRLHGLNFAPGATKVDKNASKILDKAVEAIAEFPDATLAVEAHTDADGSEKSNQELSEARARNVGSYLSSKLNIPRDKIVATGYGESQPIADNDSKAGKAQNRRIEIVLTLPK